MKRLLCSLTNLKVLEGKYDEPYNSTHIAKSLKRQPQEPKLVKELNQSHKQLQSDIRGWIKNNNLTLVRDNYNESFFQKERIFLNKN